MILTVSLNPAIDKTCKIQTLIPGQVNRLNETQEFPGGKGVNVTRILRQLKADVMAAGLAGGYNGEFIRRAVMQSGAKDGFTIINENTRVNTNIIGDDGYVTEILDPGPVITKDDLNRFIKDYEAMLLKSDIVIISGSLPRGVGVFTYNDMVEKANALGKKVIVDTSMHPLKNVIEAKPFMIKPNIKEMEFLTGNKLDTNEKIVMAGKQLVDKGIEYVVVSMGSKGFIHIDRENVIYVKAPKVNMVNTVGCGDSMVAAYGYGIANNMAVNDMVKLAAAVSASNATTAESGHIDMDVMEELKDSIKIESGI